MRASLNSLGDLDSDMREQNLRLLATMEERTAAAQIDKLSKTDVGQAA